MLSLVIPAYNEGAVIENTVREALRELPSLGEDWELIVVDDGSCDDTAAIAEKAGAGHPVRVVRYDNNRGKGCAVKTGVFEARGDYIFCTDADLAYGLKVVKNAAAQIRETGADIIAGSRKLDREAYRSYPFVRRLTSGCFSLASKALTGMDYDTQCGFKGYKRESARELFSRCREERFAFDFEIMLLAEKLGMKICEMPVRIINHKASKVNVIRDSLKMARDIFRIKKRVAGTELEIHR